MYSKQINICNSLVNGYQVFCDSEHPLVNSQGYVYVHRHVASIKIGRWLKSNEHVHHLDENKTNNSAENLKILSCKDHSKEHAQKRPIYIRTCIVCKKDFESKNKKSRKTCSDKCYENYHKSRYSLNITKEELEKLVWEMPSEKIGELYGVSGRAIGKRCEKYGISKPPRGYWAKQRRIVK